MDLQTVLPGAPASCSQIQSQNEQKRDLNALKTIYKYTEIESAGLVLQENDTFEDRMEAVRYGWMGKKRESGEMQFQIIQKKDTGKLQGAGKHWQKRAMLRAMENAMNWDKEVLFKVQSAGLAARIAGVSCSADCIVEGFYTGPERTRAVPTT